MAGHRAEIRAERREIEVDRAGGLRGVEEKRDAPFPAERRDLIDGQDISELAMRSKSILLF